jgi:hypothetical protein
MDGLLATDPVCPPHIPNGHELTFAPDAWNEHSRVNNCYAYALGVFDADREKKPQPGEITGGLKPITPDDYTCPAITERMMADFPPPHVLPASEATVCPSGYYKVALAVDEKRDYHFYRQDPDGRWSHKMGERQVTRLDGAQREIINPRCAVSDYGAYNYDTFCGYFCATNPSQQQ